MGKTSSKSKNAYNAKTYDRIVVLLKKGEKEKLKEEAAFRGYESLNRFILDAIEHYLSV